MSNAESPPNVTLPQPTYSTLAGVLSYLVPGLGQIYQGRIVKGVLFLVCLYGMFFYGMSLGQWQNVYLPPFRQAPAANQRRNMVDGVLDFIRPLGQVWIGVVVWPAIVQSYVYDPGEEQHPVLGTFMRMPPEAMLSKGLRDSDKTPDIGWMYTVIAGVLNILVIYDAFAGPAFATAGLQPSRQPSPQKEAAVT